MPARPWTSSDRYEAWDDTEFVCRDCGAVIEESRYPAHDAFHDRLDRLEATSCNSWVTMFNQSYAVPATTPEEAS